MLACLLYHFPLQHNLAAEAAAIATGEPKPKDMIGGAFELRGKRKDGMMKRMAAVLWLMREKLPPSLFPSLMKLLVRTGSFEGHKGGQDGLIDSDRASHTSQDAAWEFTESLAWASRQTIRSEIADAPVIAATQDEAQDSSKKSQQITFFRYPLQSAKGWIKVRACPLYTTTQTPDLCRSVCVLAVRWRRV